MKTFVLLLATVAIAAANYEGGYGGYESKGYEAKGYGGKGYGGGYAEAGPAKSYAYAAAAPKVDCGYNLLVGCAPTVAKAPCIPQPAPKKYGGGYKKESYAKPEAYGKPEPYGKPEAYGKAEGGYGGKY